MVETALKINPSLCVSSPPTWAQPFTMREKAFMHQARAYFPVSVQPDKLKCLQPDLWNTKMENFRTAHLNFWKRCRPVYPDLPGFMLSLKRFCAATGVTTNPRIQKKEQGGGFKTVYYSSRD